MPGFRGVRHSKFRHVYGQPFRKEWCYNSIRISKNTYDSNFCAVNPKYLAVIAESGGGGCFIVIPVEKCGRVDMNAPKVYGHTAQVLDVKWYPFDDNIIASSSEDGTVIVWRIPNEEMTENLTEYIVLLRGHGRKCGLVEWHPTAEFILASGGFDGQVIVWNIEQGEAVFHLSCGRNAILSVSFNWDGSLLATTSKDKKLRIFDPRTQELLQEEECHSGAKGGKCTFLGESDFLVTTGSERGSASRQVRVWNKNDLKQPLASIDVSNGTGVLFPFPDHDNNVVYVAGKGDGNIRFFEITETSPFIFSLNEYISGNPQRGLGSMPKRGLNTANCEIMRFYKLYASKSYVEPISMIVPRRYDSMQKDLYPDTCGTEPAMTTNEWLSGINRPPKLLSLGGVSRKRRTEPEKRPTPQSTQEKPVPTYTPSPPPSVQTESSVQSASYEETQAEESRKEEEKPVEVKKPRQEPKASPPVLTVNPLPQETENLDQWEIISEEIVTVSTTKVEESSAPSSEVSQVQESKKESREKVNGTHPDTTRHTLPGMEGSIPLSERLAKFQNNNNNEALPRRNSKIREKPPAKGISKPEKRTLSENGSHNPPIVRETVSKVENSFTSEGKETFRIEVGDSMLPTESTISQSKQEENSQIVFTSGSTSPSKLNRRESSSDPPAPSPRKSSFSSSGDAKEPLSSKEMGADQIRKAYLRQQQEIKQLKSQLTLKDARIRQLEKELEQYTASNC